jgi:hypothetical protein
LKASATLTVRLYGAAEGRSLSAVLAPDNEGLPPGMDLSMATRGRVLELVISAGSPSASLSTVLALLRDITLFQEVWLLSRQREASSRGFDPG